MLAIYYYLNFTTTRELNIICAIAKQKLNSEVYYGRAVAKFIDSPNHAVPYVLIEYELDTQWINLSGDSDGVYNRIAIDDTLYKAFGTDTLIIKRNGNLLIDRIIVSCPNDT